MLLVHGPRAGICWNKMTTRRVFIQMANALLLP